MENLCLILKNTGTLAELNLSWNNLRGEVAEKLIMAMKENYTIKKLDLSYNLFGLSTPGMPPAALKFSEVLQENVVLEELNLSNNLIDGKVAFCIAHGLQNNTSLKSFEINGNPIGSSGIKFLIQSINNNEKGKVKNIKMKETDTLVQTVKQQIFDPLNVEREYRLDLASIYDRVILYHLIDIDEKIFHNSMEEEQIQQGD
jgi:Ran GTPase-activating protein (RanGAP) involved in mRNA processing and transport